ncbi:LysR substrate-binding domain-containing protein [Opitutus sp. ER46]|uniref:LysR family transcriptional regulator n=1 Tax=Opitutus sp. ER46 TaxID=2161864 RepID=UPI000D30A4B7|nr:LysR substrate-binding domain-containing protein [Opitutus sp. ER46]PTX97958.1 LysR family transcriptional regulator [Opitutus sp. ER46]
MELRHLRYFVAVAEALSFRRAAERLRVAHPALSNQIRDLEDELAVRLLDRNTSRVRLTDAGRVLLEEARAVLRRTSVLAQVVREAGAGRSGRLAVGNVGPISATFMPAVLLAYRERFPQVEVMLHEMDLPDQIAGLDDGTLQLGFTMRPAAEIPPRLDHVLVLRTPVCALVGRRHRLAALPRITPADAQAEVILCVGTGPRFPGHAERVIAAFEANGLPAPKIRRVNSSAALFTLIAGHQGIAFMPALPGLPPSSEIVVRPVKQVRPEVRFEMHAVWRRGDGSALVRNFIEVLKRTIRVRPQLRDGAANPAG